MDPSPHLLLINGRIHTLDASDRTVEALAVRGGTIEATGSTAEISALRGPGTRVLDLEGKTVVPGFYDAHPHLDRMGLRDLCGVKIAHCKSVEAICAKDHKD